VETVGAASRVTTATASASFLNHASCQNVSNMKRVCVAADGLTGRGARE
jgi:hypothetical protein